MALLGRYAPDWIGAAAGGGSWDALTVTGEWWHKGLGFGFRRGFVERVMMSPAQFGRFAHRLFAAHPIRAVHFATGLQHRTPRGWLRPAIARPEFRRLTEVDLSNSWADAGTLAELAGCGNLGRVRCLDLSWTLRLTPAGLRRVASLAFAVLRSLTARNARALGRRDAPDTLAGLVASPRLAGLEALDVWCNALGDEGAGVLARAAWPLRSLGLGASGITSAGAAVLVRSPRLAGLRELTLAHNRLGDAAVEAIAASPSLAQVRVFDLSDAGVGDGGAIALAARPWPLDRLDLARNPGINEQGIATLRNRYGDRLCVNHE
ncbi:MAG TPA: hypothetical protein VGE74_23565 [Gemmata sp.]